MVRTVRDPNQIPLLIPDSPWRPRAEFPTLRDLPVIGIDTETRDPGIGQERGSSWARPGEGEIIGVSVSHARGTYYYPVGHLEDNLDRARVFSYLREELKNFTGTLVGANLVYDLGWLGREDVEAPLASHYDVQYADALIDEHQSSYSLQAISTRFKLEAKDETLLREAANVYSVDPKSGMYRLPARFVGAYAERDAQLPPLIRDLQLPLIEQQNLHQVVKLEHDLLPLNRLMQQRGVRVNLDRVDQVRKILQEGERKFKIIARRESGMDLDIWSSASVATAFLKLGIKFPTTAMDAPSFRQEWLDDHDHPLCRAIVGARRYNKAWSTFIDGTIMEHVDKNGYVHPSWHPLRGERGGTGPGRYACTEPNMQQIPARNEDIAPLLRSCFVPEDGSLWYVFDVCFSPDTEILTQRGFVRFDELEETDDVAQWSDGVISFVKPTARQVRSYSGDLVHVVGRYCDLLVTPNHRCLIETREGLKFVPAERYPVGLRGYGYQLTGGEKINGDLSLSYDQLDLLCAIQADGALRRSKKRDHKTGLRFYLKKARKIEALTRALANLDISHSSKQDGYGSKPGYTTITVKMEDVPSWIWEWLELSTKTFISERWRRLDLRSRKVLASRIGQWDGRTGDKIGTGSYFSTNLSNVELVQELLSMTGYRTVSSQYETKTGRPFKHLSFQDRRGAYTKGSVKSNVPYEGNVYCVSVPASCVVIRRGGKVMVTGQCQQEPRFTTHYAALMDLPRAREAAARINADPSTDYHQMVAEMTGLPRKAAKEINLGKAYGMGGAKLCKKLGLPTEYWYPEPHRPVEVAGPEGKKIIAQYDREFPFIKALSQKTQDAVKVRGWLRTYGGRVQRFPLWWPKGWSDGDRTPLPYERALERYGNQIERAWTKDALNKLIQGSSADMMKLAMLLAWKEEGVVPRAQVHDELDVDVETEAKAKRVDRCVRESVKLLFPMATDVERGPSWGECKPVEGW